MTSRENVIQIFKAAVDSVHPERLIPAHLFTQDNKLYILDQPFLLNELPEINVIGAGKACAAMAKAVEIILGDWITRGIVVTKYAHSLPLQKIICLEAAHPVPDEQGIAATEKTIQLLQSLGENDIIICLISGGASSLWIDVAEGASLDDVQETFHQLIKCGATINEVNTVRKHLSAIKGGQLLQYAPRSNWFSLIISDVPGDDLGVIASGPTVVDHSTFQEAKWILEKYKLLDQLPFAITEHINKGIKGMVAETLKSDDPVFEKIHNRIIGNNSIALAAAAAKARELGYDIPYINKNLAGDSAIVGRELMRFCKNYSGKKPACFLLGGETTVTVTGNGKGGRNQHMALSALMELAVTNDPANLNKITFLSAGTDGTDGPTDAAGAIVDNPGLLLTQQKQLDPAKYFEANDSFHFFQQINGLIKTGATQTNVMDLIVVIVDN